MARRAEYFICLVAAALVLAACAEYAPPPSEPPKVEVENDLSDGFELPAIGESEGLLPAYQTESEIAEAGKADAIDVRASYEEIYGYTYAPSGNARAVAEWEPVDGVLVSWTDGLDGFLTDLVATLHRSTTVYLITPSLSYSRALKDHFERQGMDSSRIRFFEYSHEAFWTRDFGPLTVELADGRPAFVDTSYYYNRRRDDAVPTLMGHYFDVPVYRPRISSEGGNFMTNGQGLCATTTWMLEENPHLNADSLADEMSAYLGCRTTIILDRLYGEGTGHIDMFAKFTQPDTVLVGRYDYNEDPTNARIVDRNAERLANVRLPDGRPLRVVRIPMPAPRYQVYASFTNSIFVNGTAIVPTYSYARHLESEAVRAYQAALPAGWRVVLVDSTDVIELGGAVHCTAMAFNTRRISAGTSVPSPTVEPTGGTGRYGVTPSAPILDNQVTTSVISVPSDGSATAAGNVEIELRVDHTYVGDLYIVLEHGGIRGLVYEGSGPGHDLNRTFTTDLYRDTLRSGDWTLSIRDRADQDQGTLQSWSLAF